MSPRREYITIKDWPTLKSHFYHVQVAHVTANGKAGILKVTLSNLNPKQLGRIHELELPLPVHPGSRTCQFLAACGIEANEPGTKIYLDSIVHSHLRVKFSKTRDVVGFRQIENESEIFPSITKN